ncbi:hypothetical protein HDU96_006011 [Phlyctochytrium bullatum]|nr:hypothetical protein HDU96_006011 [Phlyctochytrium bullatum]
MLRLAGRLAGRPSPVLHTLPPRPALPTALASLRPLTTPSTPSSSTPSPSPPPTKHKDDYDGVFTPDKDPMAHLSEAEKEQIRRDVREQSARAYSIGYGIIGGGAAAALLLVLFSTTRS